MFRKTRSGRIPFGNDKENRRVFCLAAQKHLRAMSELALQRIRESIEKHRWGEV
jgi:hypothetical protein